MDADPVVHGWFPSGNTAPCGDELRVWPNVKASDGFSGSYRFVTCVKCLAMQVDIGLKGQMRIPGT